MTLEVCRFCGNRAKLIEAHIVPRAFHPDDNDIRVLSSNSPRTRRAPKGIYDRQILCAQCDGRFGVYENYAATLLRPRPRRADLYRGQDGFIARGFDTKWLAYWVRQPDVQKLQTFGASLLWRAGITIRPEMSIELDPAILERARRVIEGDDASYFPIMAMRCEPQELSGFVARPTLFDETFAPGVRFYMNGIVLNIFVRAPTVEPEASSFLLGQGDAWLIGFVPFRSSKYAEAMADIFRLLEHHRLRPKSEASLPVRSHDHQISGTHSQK
jgi:hypothetical protein